VSDASSAFGWLRKRLAELRGAGARDEPLLPRVAVVTDSAAALPEEVQQAFAAGALSVVPMPVMVDGEIFSEGDAELGERLSLALAAGKPVKTSRPSPGQFEQVYQSLADQGFDAVVSVHISAELSGTVDAARLAARRVAIPVEVLDSRTVAMAMGFGVRAALVAAAAGGGSAAVAETARQALAGSKVFFYVPSLEQLRRGGRIGNAASWLGTVLAIKPLLSVADGRVVPLERVRSASRAIARVEELAREELGLRTRPTSVAVHDFGNREQALELLAKIADSAAPTEIFISDLPSVLAAHVGLGVLAVVISDLNGPLDPDIGPPQPSE